MAVTTEASSTGMRPPAAGLALGAVSSAPSFFSSAVSSAMAVSLPRVRRGLLGLQVGHRLEHVVRNGDDPGARLEAALRDDHVGELSRQVGVGGLEHAGLDRARTGLAAGVVIVVTRGRGVAVEAAAVVDQAVVVVEF